MYWKIIQYNNTKNIDYFTTQTSIIYYQHRMQFPVDIFTWATFSPPHRLPLPKPCRESRSPFCPLPGECLGPPLCCGASWPAAEWARLCPHPAALHVPWVLCWRHQQATHLHCAYSREWVCGCVLVFINLLTRTLPSIQNNHFSIGVYFSQTATWNRIEE